MRRLLTVLVLALAPASAQASSVHMQVGPGPQSSVGSGRPYEIAYLTVKGAPGETNRFELTRLPDAVLVSDGGAPLQAEGACAREDDHRARCPVPTGENGTVQRSLNTVTVLAGDGDDRVRASLPGLSVAATIDLGDGDDLLQATAGAVAADGEGGHDSLTAAASDDRLTGGPGDDRLVGGAGDDTLIEAEGDAPDQVADPPFGPVRAARFAVPAQHGGDVFDGGAGVDLVSFAGRRAPIRADLVSGRASENRLRGVERVQGGRGADHISGDRHANHLLGGAGRDRLDGRGGSDDLYDGEDVRGGPGADRIWFVPLRARIDCGGGRDHVDAPTRRSTLTGCEVADVHEVWENDLPVRFAPRALATGRLLTVSTVCRGCRVRIRVIAAAGPVIAARAVRIRSARRRAIVVRLTAAGRRLLAAPGRTRAVVRLRMSSEAAYSFRVRL